MPFFSGFPCYSRNRYTSFYASVDTSTPAQYRFHVYLFVNPKRELEFQKVVTVGLQDKSFMYIHNTVNLICFHFICLLLRNLVDWILPAQTLAIFMAAIVPFIIRVYADKIQNNRLLSSVDRFYAFSYFYKLLKLHTTFNFLCKHSDPTKALFTSEEVGHRDSLASKNALKHILNSI